MLSENPFYHTFKTLDGYYIYDVNRNKIIKILKPVYEILQYKDCNTVIDDTSNCTIQKLKEDGFLSSNRVHKIMHPATQLLPYYLDRKLHSITFQVTQQCNLRCQYCAYSGSYNNRTHSNKRMPFELATQGIDFLISHSSDSPNLNIGFYGGEPLLELGLIKKCIEYAKKKSEGKKLTFSITTNATLLSEAIIDYFSKNSVSLTISLDGPKDIHNKNRRFASNNEGTFDKVIENIEMIRIKFPKYYEKVMFNAVIDRENDLSCTNTFFSNCEGIKDLMVAGSLVNDLYSKKTLTSDEDFRIKWEYEFFKSFLFKFGRLNKNYASKFNEIYFWKIKKLIFDNKQYLYNLQQWDHPSGPCIPGVERLFVNYNGDLYPCERVSEASQVMKIGTISKGYDIDKIEKLLNIGRFTENSCINCWAFRLCTACAAFADDLGDLSSDKKMSYCKSIKNEAEETLKNYCTLIEFGHKFDEDSMLISYI